MISDNGLPSHNNSNTYNNNRDSTASVAGNMANYLSPNLGSVDRMSGNNQGINMTHIENGALSPLLQGQSWAAMMNTPLMSSFGASANTNPNAGLGAGAQDGTFPRLDMSNNNGSNSTWASQNNIGNGIVLDDAKKFRRTGRSSDQGLPLNPNNNNGNNAGNANQQHAAMAAQQNWRNMNSGNNGYNNNTNQNNNNMQGSASHDLSSLATLQAAIQQMSVGANGNQNNNNPAAALASPQMAMANLLAAQQQIQQQMQIQQLMAGMSPMGMMNTLQQQQMLSPGE